jgi:transposase
MLGLPGFVLIAVSELEDEIEQAVQTTADLMGCPGCGAVAASHGRRPVRVRDLPAAGRAVTLIWLKRLWRCEHAECDVNTWSEQSPAIRPRSSLTERARKEACRRVGRDGHTVAQVAAQFGVGWATIMKAVTEYGRPAVDDPARLNGVRTLGVDETAFTAAGPRRSTTFATGIVDMSGPTARLLDVVPGRSGKALAQWISHRPPGWAEQVQVAALDPFRGYATALTDALPAAVRVLDCFHVTRPRLRRRGRRPPPGATRGHRAPRPQGRAAVPDPPGAAPPRRPPE